MPVKGDYRAVQACGVTIGSGAKSSKERLAQLLEDAGKIGEDLGLYVAGHPFQSVAATIIGAMQRTGDVIVFDQIKQWGVKILEPARKDRWYTNERHNQFDAQSLADHYNTNARREHLQTRYIAEVIPPNEHY